MTIPDYLRKTTEPPPSGDSPIRQVAWLRSHIRPFAIYCAMLQVSGEESDTFAQSYICLAAIGTANDLEWPPEIAAAAAKSEIASSLEIVRNAADRIIAAVRPKIFRHDPAEEVLAAAKSADPGALIPTPVLIDFCAKIAQARMPRRVRA